MESNLSHNFYDLFLDPNVSFSKTIDPSYNDENGIENLESFICKKIITLEKTDKMYIKGFCKKMTEIENFLHEFNIRFSIISNSPNIINKYRKDDDDLINEVEELTNVNDNDNKQEHIDNTNTVGIVADTVNNGETIRKRKPGLYFKKALKL